MPDTLLAPRAASCLTRRGRRRPARRYPAVEVLEGRSLMAAWVEQGPGNIFFGQIEGLDPQGNPVGGAVEVVLPHPTDSSIAYVAAANGGIWMSTNVRSEFPSWTPLTDDQDSLAIGDIQFDPLDSSFQTIFAGTGSFSSLALTGGRGTGLLKTTDGGLSWTNLARTDLEFRKIKSVVPTTLETESGQVVLVGTFLDPFAGGGLFRSEDGGNSFTRLSGDGSSGLPDAEVSHLVPDPANPERFYAGVPNFGVYRSDDGGETWTQINDGLVDPDMANSRVELAVHFNSENETHAIYTALLRDGQPTGFFRSDDFGDNWVEMDLPVTNEGGMDVGLNPRAKPGAQGMIHFSMLADLTDPFVVFAGGDRQPLNIVPNSIGATTFSGRLFRGDASLPAGSQWEPVTHDGTVTNSAPHADSRDMAFDADGNIVEGDDGGVYRLLDPNDLSGDRNWVSSIGDLRPTEFHSVAYDTITGTVFGGTQDVGTPMQQTPGSTSDWVDYSQADGGVVAVDTTTDPLGRSIRYSSFQFFGFFNRSYWNPDGSPSLLYEGVPLVVNGTGGLNLFQFDGTIQFYQPYELNAVDQNRMVIGTSFLYESFNRGDNLDFLGGGATTSAMAYGGRLSGVNNPNVIYIGNFGAPNALFLRTTVGGAFTQLVNYPGFFVRDIALDPQNWRRAYVVDFADQVWATFNAGTSWVSLTGNINTLSSTPELTTIAMVSPTASIRDDIVLVGGNGGVFAIRTPGIGGASLTWTELTGLPNALTRDIRYHAGTDTLVAGLQGRGAWLLGDVTAEVPPIITAGGSALASVRAGTTTRAAARSRLDAIGLALAGIEPGLRGSLPPGETIGDLYGSVPWAAKARKRARIRFDTTIG